MCRWIERPTLQAWGHHGGEGGAHRADGGDDVCERIALFHAEHAGMLR